MGAITVLTVYRHLLLACHIAAVAAWLGCNFTQFFLAPWFRRRGGDAAVAWFEASNRLARMYYNVAGTVLAVSGVLLVRESGFRWSAGFVGVGLAVVIIGGVVGVAFFAPDGARLASAQRAGASVNLRRYLLVLSVDSTLVLTAVVAMVSKWRA